MEITYHREGDYLIPDLKLSDTTEYQIGKYGRMRKRFLEENHRGIYSYMILSETLWKYPVEIDEECNDEQACRADDVKTPTPPRLRRYCEKAVDGNTDQC